MTDIKIAVACHKPSELPHNPLYVPVQVGSAIAPRRMEALLMMMRAIIFPLRMARTVS